MKNANNKTGGVTKLSGLAKKIDKQLMDLLVSELENFRSKSTSQSIRIA